ncbi:hypothetical protein K9M74_00505 [Candidatus Woesearchaeota archaeon]|nr:hypothetical protein [Candidatus Woesearchaeota archaeon]
MSRGIERKKHLQSLNKNYQFIDEEAELEQKFIDQIENTIYHSKLSDEQKATLEQFKNSSLTKRGCKPRSIVPHIWLMKVLGERTKKPYIDITEDDLDKLKISRFTFREYLPTAYQKLDIHPDTIIKRVKDTRQYMIDVLLRDFRRCDDPLQRNNLSKNISGLLDSQEKSSRLILAFEEGDKEEIITSGTGLFTKYLSRISNKNIIQESECQIH